MDSGPTSSFCSDDLAREQGLNSHLEMLSLTTLDGTGNAVLTSVVSLNVSDLAANQTLHIFKVYVRSELSVTLSNVVERDDISRWQLLHQLEFPTIACKVGLLIGQDTPDALHVMPLEIVSGNEPIASYAVKTVLG